MLIKLCVSNFLSFRDEVEFTALASLERQHSARIFRHSKLGFSVLPTAALWGGNGAGKSNLYCALRFARHFILRGSTRIEDVIAVEPFRLDREYLKKPSTFRFDVLIKDQVYRYCFAVTSQQVLSESLEEVNDEKTKLVFRREQGEWNLEYFDRCKLPEKERDFIQFKARDTLRNQLFLSSVRGRDLPILEEIGDWFSSKLALLDPHCDFRPIEISLQDVEAFQKYCVKALQRAGTGIDLIKNEKVSLDSISMPPGMRDSLKKQLEQAKDDTAMMIKGPDRMRFLAIREKGETKALQLVTFHKDRDGKQVRFEMPDESEGTERLIDLLPAFFELSSAESDKVFFIDELDRSLHTHLTRGLIESFLKTRSNSSRAQLLFTTHDPLLLDQELLRRDEIWFIDKDENGQSSLNSLSDFKGVRYDKDIRKSYLQGRFGGVSAMQPLPRRDEAVLVKS
jgi:AAA15 family ATPase/GTPase